MEDDPKVENLKEIFEHIKTGWEMIDKHNQAMAAKATSMLGFCGVILTLIVRTAIECRAKLSWWVAMLLVMCVLALAWAIFAYMRSIWSSVGKGIIKPDRLIQEYRAQTSRSRFWVEYVKAAEKIYASIKKENERKSGLVWGGDVSFLVGMGLAVVALLFSSGLFVL